MRILVISRVPFGFLTDAVKLCEHAAQTHEVYHLSFDVGRFSPRAWKTPQIENVELLTVSRDGWYLARYWRWIMRCVAEVRKSYDVVYVYYFPTAAFLVWPRLERPIVLDIRSGSVALGRLKRFLMDALLRAEAAAFPRVHIISEGLRGKLRISESKSAIVPLGADRVLVPKKRFSELNLVYVGMLNGRRIHDTIEGFSRFVHAHPEANATYTIVGGDRPCDLEKLKRCAVVLDVEGLVHFVGYVPHVDLSRYFTESNVGVAYVPITPYFDHQPVTKTFEYLLAGMPVIATATSENRRVISDTNGLLIPDTPDGFYQALKRLFEIRSGYDSEDVRASAAAYTWESIISRDVLPALERYAAPLCDSEGHETAVRGEPSQSVDLAVAMAAKAASQESAARKVRPVRVVIVGPGPTQRGGIATVIGSILNCDFGDGVEVSLLDTWAEGSFLTKAARAVRAILRAILLAPRVDTFHIHAAVRVSFYRKAIIAAIALAFRKRLLFHIHSGFQWVVEARGLRRCICAAVLKNADPVIVLSSVHARALAEVYPGIKTFILPNCCAVQRRPVSAHEIASREEVVLFAGHIIQQKGVFDLIVAFEQVAKARPRAKLVIMGAGDQEKAASLARRVGVASQVEFPGWLTGAKKFDCFCHARVFCLPSYSEGVPISVLEAMSCGVPVVTTPVGGIPDIIQQDVNGILVDPGDADALSCALLYLLSNAAESFRLASAAIGTLESKNSPAEFTKRLRALYQSAEGGHPRCAVS